MQQAPVPRHPVEIIRRGGVDGKSAYEVAVDNGFVGTEEEWLESLSGSPGVNGIAALRALPVEGGQTVHLNYHTAVGDLGGGDFYGVTTGSYTDDDGTVVVPGGGAWLRVWDQITAHVGWFGAKCDHVTDDYVSVHNALKLFTDGRNIIRDGMLEIGRGFDFSEPIIIGGNTGRNFKLKGELGRSGNHASGSYIRYTGPAREAGFILYGACNTVIEDVNLIGGNAYNAVLVTADNQVQGRTLVNLITAGESVVATISSTTTINAGCFIGIDTGDNLEVVLIQAVDAGANTITANFTKNHAAGVVVGCGTSHPSTAVKFHHCLIEVPVGPCGPNGTTLTGAPAAGLFTTDAPHNLKLGMAVRIGSLTLADVSYVTSVPSTTTFTVLSAPNAHVAGDQVIYATAGVLWGNNTSNTCQVSEGIFQEVMFVGAVSSNTCHYAGFRGIGSGNVKNVSFNDMGFVYLKVPFDLAGVAGQLYINGAVGTCQDTIIKVGPAALTVISLEDESTEALLLIGGSGSNTCQATFIGCAIQNSRPANNTLLSYLGELTCIGCQFYNNKSPDAVPIFMMSGIRSATSPGSLTLIDCFIDNATLTGANSAFVMDGAVDVIADGTGKLTMLGCIGGVAGAGASVRLPTLIPSLDKWQNVATYDPPNLLANTADTVQTMTVTGAALGDLVEVSFSLNLGEMLLRAWVSAVNTVSYQFRNPTAAPIDLGSGTVKCRVKK